MLKNGLNNKFLKKTVLVFLVPLILFLMLVYLFSFSGIYRHNKKLQRLESVFSTIEHPANTEQIEYYVHLGEGPYVSGDGDNECHYYVAEIRSFFGDFREIEAYYDNDKNYIGEEFVDGWINAMEINENNRHSGFLDIPTSLWFDNYLENTGGSAYIVYARFSDTLDTLGDYRCWREW